MAYRKFALDNLKELDGGRLAVAFEQAMKRVIADCEDRPGEDKARTVTMQFDVSPILEESGLCEDVHVIGRVKDQVPVRRSKKYRMQLRKGGMLAFDDDDRRDSVCLMLSLSEPFGRLSRLSHEKPLTQRQLVWLLNHELRDCVPETLVGHFRRLDFSRRSDGTRVKEHGAESLGVSVESRVQGREGLPDFFVASVPVFRTHGCTQRQQVRVTVEIDVDQQTFEIAPAPDSLQFALEAQGLQIMELINQRGGGVCVFLGSP